MRRTRWIALLAASVLALGLAWARPSAALEITGVTPAGPNVPAGRQIVIRFDRPVVPLGRMRRDASEIPVETAPALQCDWRWLEPAALACELGPDDAFRLATRYSIVVAPGITAIDGTTTVGVQRFEFVTERPRVSYAGFSTWKSPGTPVLRVLFTQPVTRESVREHLFVSAGAAGATGAHRRALLVEPDPDAADAPVPLADGYEARAVWRVTPSDELPPATRAALTVEPGLVGAQGDEPGDESRVIVEFATFPEFEFLGVVCETLAKERILIAPPAAAATQRCNPLGAIALSFSAPVIATEIRDHVELAPDLAGDRDDYDPWANRYLHSVLSQPHETGRTYEVWLPERLRAATEYALTSDGDGPRDEFGRALTAPMDLSFATDHRPPSYTLAHETAVLERGVDSEVPLYVTNLDRVTLDYRSLTPAGAPIARSRAIALPDVEDVQYGVSLGVREMLGGDSGALYARLAADPPVPQSARGRGLFAQVTPYELHVKLGHFSSLVWVVDLATGRPVPDAAVSIYVDRLTRLTADGAKLAVAQTDASGVALLPGTRVLDPQLRLLAYGCGETHIDACARLFVRVDGRDGMALLPLEHRFEVNAFRASNYTVWSRGRPAFGHLHTWGTTAQGVYRAGDTMEFKVYVRDQDNEAYVPAPRGLYDLDIVDPTGRTVHTTTGITLSEFGAFDGTYAIPQTAAVGWYQFRLRGRFGPGDDEIVREPLRVLVSDFTPSAFRVTTSLSADVVEAGDEIAVETQAALFSGGPYLDAEARVTARVEGRRFVSSHPAAVSFQFESGSAPQAATVAQLTGTLDAEGRVVLPFTVPEDLGRQIVHGTLSVEGAVRDDRGRYVASAARADFVAVDRLVGLRSTRWVFAEDEPAQVEYLVVDARGAPVAGTPVHVDIERLETKAARVKGAGNAYLTQFISEWVPAGSCDGVSADAPLACGFVPSLPGSYRATAIVTDTRGRAHKTTIDTWVAGAGHVVWRHANDDALEIVPEKSVYAVGETARYLVKNPYPGARALVTIERYGVLDQWVQTLEGSTPIVEFPIEPHFLPGFYLSVLVMSPRVEAPLPKLGELDLGKPAFKLGYLAVAVADAYKEIAVDVTTDAEQYKPGDTVHVRIGAAPREGARPEAIEIAVAVLDEAVLDLIQGGTRYFDPYAGFYALDGLDVRGYSLLSRLVGRQKIELKGANPGGDGGAAISMRSLFKFVSYWNPSIVLDDRGEGGFAFELPDNLTGWRVLVLATTPTDRMGLGMTSIRATLPTELRPVMPNHVTEGDRFAASFSVMNRTASAREVRVAIAATGDVEAPAAHEETVHLEPFARTTVQMPVVAGRIALGREQAAGRIRFTVTAADAIDADGLEHALEVGARRVLETVATHGALDGDAATVPLRFPDAIHTDAGDVGTVLAASVVGNLDGAFRFLRDYPYTCWEQRLTKGVMAAHYGRLRGYLPADVEWPESTTLPAQTLAQAADYQAPNGGMTYYRPQDAHVSPYLSAYTALAFTWLRADGHSIPAAVEQRLLHYLDAFLKRDTAPDFYSRGMASTVRAVALAALARHGRVTLADLERYRSHLEHMSLFGKAHYLQAALAVPGGAATAREVERAILARSTRSAGRVAFNELLDADYLRIAATPLNANCAILSALSAGEADPSPDVPFELVRTITQARGSRDHWPSTQENMFCTRALLDYAGRYEAVTPNLAATVRIGTEAIGGVAFASTRDAPVRIARALTPTDPGTNPALTIERAGAGRLYYAARMRFASTEPVTTAVNAGVTIHREYSVQRDGEWVLLADPVRVRRGELVRVDLYVSLPSARHFLVVDDPVPGAFEPVSRDLANASLVDAGAGAFVAAAGSWWLERDEWRAFGASRFSFYHQELRHDAARFYSEYLPPGDYHLSYTAQVIAVGEFAALPAHAEEMYDPDVHGSSVPATVRAEETR
jgi:alpha-2-macroglobulin